MNNLTDNQLQYAKDRAKLIMEHWMNNLQDFYSSEVRKHRERGNIFDQEVIKIMEGK
jgi:hypothetical protein